MPSFDSLAVLGMGCWERSDPAEDVWQRTGLICEDRKEMQTAVGRSDGRQPTNSVSASTPPADAPTTMISGLFKLLAPACWILFGLSTQEGSEIHGVSD